MAKVKKSQVKTTKFKPGRRDVLTEMFEHFGIKVMDVSVGDSQKNQIRDPECVIP